MKNQGDLERDMVRGEQAKRILNDPLIVEYFKQAELDILHNLKTCRHWENQQERDALLNMLQCHANFEKNFKQYMNQGKKAKSLLERLLSKGE